MLPVSAFSLVTCRYQGTTFQAISERLSLSRTTRLQTLVQGVHVHVNLSRVSSPAERLAAREAHPASSSSHSYFIIKRDEQCLSRQLEKQMPEPCNCSWTLALPTVPAVVQNETWRGCVGVWPLFRLPPLGCWESFLYIESSCLNMTFSCCQERGFFQCVRASHKVLVSGPTISAGQRIISQQCPEVRGSDAEQDLRVLL